MTMIIKRKQSRLKRLGSVTYVGSVALAAMALLCCSKQQPQAAQVAQGKTDQAEVDGLKQQVTQLQDAVSKKNMAIEKLQQQTAPTANTVPTVSVSPGQAAAPPAAAETAPLPQHAAQFVTEQEIMFQLKGCALSGSLMKCDLLVTNKEGDKKAGFGRNERSRAIDDAGKDYPATSFTLGADVGTYSVETTLPSDVPVAGQVQFEGIKPGTKRIRLLEMAWWVSDSKGSRHTIIKFANIDL
ncbi:MAG TPA: hypothetical protein VGM86_00440 [Thermoanaerobaculia bacterium]|jgi:hypothetical protein